MTPQEKFQQQLAVLMTKPSFLTEQLLLEINEQFCRIMDEQRISRTELAERIGVKRQFITRILNGNPNITLLTLVKVATALNAKLGFELTVTQQSEQKDLPRISVPRHYSFSGRHIEEKARYEIVSGGLKTVPQLKRSLQEEAHVLSNAA